MSAQGNALAEEHMTTLPAISLWQPSAHLLATGAKRYDEVLVDAVSWTDGNPHVETLVGPHRLPVLR